MPLSPSKNRIVDTVHILLCQKNPDATMSSAASIGNERDEVCLCYGGVQGLHYGYQVDTEVWAKKLFWNSSSIVIPEGQAGSPQLLYIDRDWCSVTGASKCA